VVRRCKVAGVGKEEDAEREMRESSSSRMRMLKEEKKTNSSNEGRRSAQRELCDA